MNDNTETYQKIWDVLKEKNIEYSGYSCNGVNLVGDRKSIDAVIDMDYKIARLEAQVKRLEDQLAAKSWEGQVDRMGGCFTEEEIRSATEWK